jgi:hypothetical protein
LDNGGTIDAKEIVEVLYKLGINITEKYADQMIKDVDTDKNSILDFEEFKNLVNKINLGEYGFIKRDEKMAGSNKQLSKSTSLAPIEEEL